MPRLPYERVKKELICKRKCELGRPFRKTATELLNMGLINLDKPKGPKSIHVVNKIRAILEQPKAGHAGTLDPAVTGVLPVGLGKGVKILPVISKAGKVYEGKMHLHGSVTEKEVEEVFKKFTGKIRQLPPRISAVARRERVREIYWLVLKKMEGKSVEFEVGCEAGTYIRKLCHDIGETLKVGAHMQSLRRIQAGPFKIKGSVTLREIRENYAKFMKTGKDIYIREVILPPESGVAHLPRAYVDSGVVARIRNGSPVFVPGLAAFTSDLRKENAVAIFDTNKNLLAIGVAAMDSGELKKAKKGLAVKTDFVLI